MLTQEADTLMREAPWHTRMYAYTHSHILHPPSNAILINSLRFDLSPLDQMADVFILEGEEMNQEWLHILQRHKNDGGVGLSPGGIRESCCWDCSSSCISFGKLFLRPHFITSNYTCEIKVFKIFSSFYGSTVQSLVWNRPEFGVKCLWLPALWRSPDPAPGLCHFTHQKTPQITRFGQEAAFAQGWE